MANNRAVPADQMSVLEGLIPGTEHTNELPLVKKRWPTNASHRDNKLGGQTLQNTFPNFPEHFNEGLDESRANLRILAETFQDDVASRGEEGYRQVFAQKYTIPLHMGTLAKQFMKSTGIDESPYTAGVTGIDTWNPTWNEVTLEGSAVEATTHIWGRFFKRNKFTEDIGSINWFAEIQKKFAPNASRTLDNLAGIRLYEGANKLFIKSVDPFDPTDPAKARIALGASETEVAAGLTFDALKEAQWLMQNYQEDYTTVDPLSGTVTSTNKRLAVIRGVGGGDIYKVLVGRNGYHQILNDPDFRNAYVVNGGQYASDIVNMRLGISSPVFGLSIDVVDNPITIMPSKAGPAAKEPSYPFIDVNGQGSLEVAFVYGGNESNDIAVELSLEGWTKIIDVGYDEDRKVDPFGLLAFTGWVAAVDFTVIQNEAIYAVVYTKKAPYVKNGNPVNPLANQWKK